MDFIIGNLGIIALILIAYVAYKKYQKGWFSKDKKQGTEKKELTKLEKWWNQSYIREVYVVRARQRRLQSFIPEIGLNVSIFASFFFAVFAGYNFLYPEPSSEELQRYDGIVKGYYYHKKTDNILVVKLNNGELKRFHAYIYIRDKYPKKNWIEKKASIWAHQEWGLLSGFYDSAVWIQFDGNKLDKVGYEKQYTERYERGLLYFPRLVLSLQWVVGFLGLIWFINRKPVLITDKKQLFSPFLEWVLALLYYLLTMTSMVFILVLGSK